jgi:hypothetical protein
VLNALIMAHIGSDAQLIAEWMAAPGGGGGLDGSIGNIAAVSTSVWKPPAVKPFPSGLAV